MSSSRSVSRPTSFVGVLMMLAAVSYIRILASASPHPSLRVSSEIDGIKRKEEGGSIISSCEENDLTLRYLQAQLCVSVSGKRISPCCNIPEVANVSHVGYAFPTQSQYLVEILNGLVSQTTLDCIGGGVRTGNKKSKQVVQEIVLWLKNNQSDPELGCSWMNVWEVFQLDYYNFPWNPPRRVESAWTLGLKSFAFAYLEQSWTKVLPNLTKTVLPLAGVEPPNLGRFETQFNLAWEDSFNATTRVMDNCFENKTFSPSRKGSCPLSILEFKAGFEKQNLETALGAVKYPY